MYFRRENDNSKGIAVEQSLARFTLKRTRQERNQGMKEISSPTLHAYIHPHKVVSALYFHIYLM